MAKRTYRVRGYTATGSICEDRYDINTEREARRVAAEVALERGVVSVEMQWYNGQFTGTKESPAAMFGRKGGQAKSERKSLSSADNGKKGGRPRNSTKE